ncbi:MAG: class I SAM-dependent methyltransferase [Betaproteobacteria bacterium]|nr:class I SAM-dependent methyltransferase [Betaproteobacteria bacterium]
MNGFKDPRTTWNNRYSAASGMLFGSAPNGWLSSQRARVSAGQRVLCPADGDGRNGVWLAALGLHAIAFDLADIGIDHAVSHARSQGLTERVGATESLAALPGQRAIFDSPAGGSLTLVCADIASWPWAQTPVDVVVAIFFQFADPALRAQIFDGFKQSLQPGGLLIIEGYGLRQMTYKTGGPGVADNLYTLSMLGEAFSGWPVLESRDCDTELAEGSAHVGPSHLISAVFRKPE